MYNIEEEFSSPQKKISLIKECKFLEMIFYMLDLVIFFFGVIIEK
jgi:hypothetical protein